MQYERMNIFYRHFNLAPDFPVIGLLGPTWKATGEPVTRMHFHNCLEIGMLYEGEATLYINDQVLYCKAPCITFIPPNVPHFSNASKVDGICRWKWLYADPIQLLPQISPKTANELNHFLRILSGENCIFPGEEHPVLLQLIQMVISEMEAKEKRYTIVVRELLYAMFMIILRSSKAASSENRYVNRPLGCIAPALTYIAENYMNDLTIEELSQMCHVSTSHFRRLFKQVIGWAPLEYLQIIRIDRACVLLYNCNYSITQISLQVGYPSPSSFNRQFRQIYGISPNQWRQKMRSEENPEVTAYFNSVSADSEQQFSPPQLYSPYTDQDRKDPEE